MMGLFQGGVSRSAEDGGTWKAYVHAGVRVKLASQEKLGVGEV